jgi:ParB/RepB/Spo0J family partition protein
MTSSTTEALEQVPVYHIPLEQIAVKDRARKNLGDINALAKDILENKQLQPGIVRRASDSDEDEGINPEVTPWVLVAGGRRYAACAVAGLDTFEAKDLGDLPPLQQKIFELAENLNREELPWADQAELRAQIHELRKQEAEGKGQSWTLDDTAAEYGLSRANLSKDISIAGEIKRDPTLKLAGSKRAAERIVEFREHTKRQEARLIGSIGRNNLRSIFANADARTWLRQQTTASVDLTLTDSPWAIGYQHTARKDQPEVYGSDYDDTEGVTFDLLTDVVPEIVRVTKETGWIVCFMAQSNYDFLKDLFETCCTAHYSYGEIIYEQAISGDWIKHMPTQCTYKIRPLPGDNRSDVNVVAEHPCSWLRAEVPGWIWYRPNSRNPTRFPELHAKNFFEPILVINRGSGRLYKHQDDCPNVLVFESEYGEERLHANQKPRPLAAEIVQRTTIAGEVVCDPFAGSGNLLAGAAELNRGIRGCELNPLTYDLALGNVGRFYGG